MIKPRELTLVEYLFHREIVGTVWLSENFQFLLSVRVPWSLANTPKSARKFYRRRNKAVIVEVFDSHPYESLTSLVANRFILVILYSRTMWYSDTSPICCQTLYMDAVS